ncbi:hypothetical protein M2139_001740 [Enterococcus sp. PF1-24]|uniref:N-acetylmuramoyl-L-alanine amidase n=1 Tax=unclassified Enterococcus TaxID=2608891 RepID=UPI00247699EF|nr:MULTISPECIES: N-acetylmuramoyl-L-alanine amidase [unclassified Enterococcus]MDH6364684.1 hypothetical protein [Enterococcus sp. PFB1-1]MDH6401840.1 hypothetical protein [Enterococcus sp. PF1-24]
MQHLIVYGHGARDSGAVGSGTNERDWTRKVLDVEMQKYNQHLQKNQLLFYDKKRNMFLDTCSGGGAYQVAKEIVSVTEIHLDAAAGLATGGHVIISNRVTANQQDLAIAEVVKKYAGWWQKVQSTAGINQRGDLAHCQIFAQRGISYRLVELGFISNPQDMQLLTSQVASLASDLITAITGESLTEAVKAENKTLQELINMEFCYAARNAIHYYNGREVHVLGANHEFKVIKDIYSQYTEAATGERKDMLVFDWSDNMTTVDAFERMVRYNAEKDIYELKNFRYNRETKKTR